MAGALMSRAGSRCSHWMSQLPPQLLDVPLWDLAIPGSHDTMTYCLDEHSPVLHSEPRILVVLDHIAPCVTRPCVKKWATTQDLSISSQLDAGIRFLDLRIAHKKKDSKRTFRFAHGIYSLLTVKEVLTDVALWLEHHSKEVVIIALSAFDDVCPAQHSNLIGFLIRLFGKKLCPKSETPSLSACWKRGYQVILSYADPSGSGHEELWPEWDYWWANESDPNLVISYLEHQKKKAGRPGYQELLLNAEHKLEIPDTLKNKAVEKFCKLKQKNRKDGVFTILTDNGFFMAGLNLTEDTRYVLCHLTRSMKSMTLQAFTVLMDWVKKQRPGSCKTSVNIICADFVGISRNEFCEIVIGLNAELIT